MKIFQVAKFYVKMDYGTEYCLSIFRTDRYSLLQMSFDFSDVSDWKEFPYISISSGCGRLLSLFFTISKFGICIDLFGRNW
jgi:hypothetical protein